MTPCNTVTHVGINFNSFELDISHGEGIRDQLRFLVKQIDDRICLRTYGFSDKYNTAPFTPDPEITEVCEGKTLPSSPVGKQDSRNEYNCISTTRD